MHDAQTSTLSNQRSTSYYTTKPFTFSMSTCLSKMPPFIACDISSKNTTLNHLDLRIMFSEYCRFFFTSPCVPVSVSA